MYIFYVTLLQIFDLSILNNVWHKNLDGMSMTFSVNKCRTVVWYSYSSAIRTIPNMVPCSEYKICSTVFLSLRLARSFSSAEMISLCIDMGTGKRGSLLLFLDIFLVVGVKIRKHVTAILSKIIIKVCQIKET